MKTVNKKTVALCAALAALLLLTVPSTVSYLTASSGKVVNTFAAGAIQLTLNEAKVDGNGNSVEDAVRVTENNYSIVPGATLCKDPTVTVLEGSVECYVFLYVDNPLPSQYFTVNYSSDWLEVSTSDTATLYVYKTTVDASEEDVTLSAIFTQIQVSSDLDDATIESLSGSKITVESYAVQVTGIKADSAIELAENYFANEYELIWGESGDVEIEGAYTGEEESEEEKNSESEEDAAEDEETAEAAETDTEAEETDVTEAAEETDTAGGDDAIDPETDDDAADTAEETEGDDSADEGSDSTSDEVTDESTVESGSADEDLSADDGGDDTALTE